MAENIRSIVSKVVEQKNEEHRNEASASSRTDYVYSTLSRVLLLHYCLSSS